MGHESQRRWPWIAWVSAALGGLALLFLLGLVAVFVWQSLPVWRAEGVGYLSGRTWFFRQHRFGTAPMIYGTAVVAGVALGLSVPLGLGTAVFLSEWTPSRLRPGGKGIIELLAGVPSVVYGLLGILLLRDWVYRWLEPWEPSSGDTLLTAGILLGVMLLPTLVTLMDDALRAVPAAQRHAARALGLTGTEAVWFAVIPQALPGIGAAVLLALGRALGEMIAVFLVVGRQDNQWPPSLLSLRPLAGAGQTLASKLGGSEVNIAYGDPLHWGAMVGLGLILLGGVGATTASAFWLLRRKEWHEA